MGFYFTRSSNDVAIYSDSMIYSNLTCFYQIKFIFSRVVEYIFKSDFLHIPKHFSIFPETSHLFPSHKGIFPHFVINVNICNRLDWIKRDRKSLTNNFLLSSSSVCVALRNVSSKNIKIYWLIAFWGLKICIWMIFWGIIENFPSGLFAYSLLYR